MIILSMKSFFSCMTISDLIISLISKSLISKQWTASQWNNLIVTALTFKKSFQDCFKLYNFGKTYCYNVKWPQCMQKEQQLSTFEACTSKSAWSTVNSHIMLRAQFKTHFELNQLIPNDCVFKDIWKISALHRIWPS